MHVSILLCVYKVNTRRVSQRIICGLRRCRIQKCTCMYVCTCTTRTISTVPHHNQREQWIFFYQLFVCVVSTFVHRAIPLYLCVYNAMHIILSSTYIHLLLRICCIRHHKTYIVRLFLYRARDWTVPCSSWRWICRVLYT